MKPRWLEILQLEFSDPHVTIGATFGVFILFLHYHYGLIPPLDTYTWLSPRAWFLLFLFGFLWVIRVVNALMSRPPKR